MAEPQAAKIARLEEQIGSLTREVAELRGDVKGLVDAWTTATGIVSFVKWVSVLAGGISVLVVTLKAKWFASIG